MPLDASIPLQVKQPQFESPSNMLAQVLSVQAAQNQNRLSQYSLSKAQRQDDETNKLAQLLSGGGVDLSTPEGQQRAYSVAPTQAGSYIKGMLENRKLVSDTGASDAKAAQERQSVAKAGYGAFQQAIGSHLNNPNATRDDVLGSVQQLVNAKVMEPAVAANLAQSLPQDPGQLKGFLRQAISTQLTPEQMLTVFAPKAEKVDAGGQIAFRDTNPNSPTFGQATGGAPIQKTVSPDAQLHADTSIRTTGMTNATSRANNTATIAAENQRAGVMPGGGMDENSERTAQAIASGQLPAPTGMALLNPKNQRILGRVMEINPQYDATTVSAKKKAASDFTTGSLGNSMRSFQVAGQHLDQLGQLVDAMGNGNMQIVNKIGNAYSAQTGSPAVTNFDAAKDVVSKEVVKAIVAGGGGVAERAELSHLMDNAKSPAQLKGVIQQYRNLMAAQHDALLQQRDAAGLPRSTLPNYTEAGGAAPTAGGMPPMNAIDAELARRAGKK